MLKLFIGDVDYKLQKKPWIPTLESVIKTQELKSKYLYNTIIIFKKETQIDYVFDFTDDVLYSSSEIDSLTQHYGVDGYILIPSYYDYFDGTYYYNYICLYSNTLDLWDISNTLSGAYAIKYDQSSVTINETYLLNEWVITKNVNELVVSDTIENVETLILPNASTGIDITTYWKVNCKEFELFDVLNYIPNQEVETFNGLLYSNDQDKLIAIPKDYQLDKYFNLYLSNLCTSIESNSLTDTVIFYEKEINMLYGENIINLNDSCFYGLKLHSFNFPKLTYIGNSVVSNNEFLDTIYLPGTLEVMQLESIQDTPTLIYVNFGYNLGEYLRTPIYLQYLSNLDVTFLGVQINNLAEIGKDSNTLYLHQVVYDSLPAGVFTILDTKGWLVEAL